jgi:hypothetical protein
MKHHIRLLWCAVVLTLCSLPAGVTFAQEKNHPPCSNSFAGASAKKAAKGRTCSCDSPCSGSITCDGGCYAFCEENPEVSGRHVCVKGCASESATAIMTAATASGDRKFARFNMDMPASEAASLMKNMFGVELTPTRRARKRIKARLFNANLESILKTLSAQGLSRPRN